MNIQGLWLIMSLLFLCSHGKAQVLEGTLSFPGRYLVQFDNQRNLQEFHANVSRSNDSYRVEKCGPNSSVLIVEGKDLTWEEFLELVSNTNGIVAVQKDYYLEERVKIPNDPLFNSSQRGLQWIKAPEAWEYTTGGVTSHGHDIVVAVLDKGFYINNPELKDNLFVNAAEIPNNGIDDDQNGYIDDVNGVNLATGSGIIEKASHGSGVMGIIGAKGNNSLGISGVNWNIKLLSVSNAVSSVSLLIKGYEYVKELRRKFNESGGQEGALVVASNLSAGVRNQWPSDQPIWCNMYDSLGKYGIISAGASANDNVDVDVVGDLPSTCESEYLIVVTNVVSTTDVKYSAAGYGSKSVDLGAPGEGSVSTVDETGIGSFGGTSCATPHVAGAIALMYSVPNIGLQDDYINYPIEAARSVRNAILDNVDILPSLQGITKTGGRLNLLKMIEGYKSDSQVVKNLNFKLYPNPVRDLIEIEMPENILENAQLEIFNINGMKVFSKSINGKSKELINVSHFEAGCYIIRIKGGNSLYVNKFSKL